MRVAEHGNRIYIDLCNENGEVVEITDAVGASLSIHQCIFGDQEECGHSPDRYPVARSPNLESSSTSETTIIGSFALPGSWPRSEPMARIQF